MPCELPRRAGEPLSERRRPAQSPVSGLALLTNSRVVRAMSASRGPTPYRLVSGCDSSGTAGVTTSLRVTASLRFTASLACYNQTSRVTLSQPVTSVHRAAGARSQGLEFPC